MATSKRRSKRQNGSAAARSQGAAAGLQSQAGAANETADNTDTAGAGKSGPDLRAEYTYVGKDVRHLAIVSIALFGVMLVIGFLI